MTATVRSVRVVLNAEIAKYVADMKLAGRATRDAFDGAGRASTDVKRSMREVEQSTGKAGAAARKAGDDFDGMGTRARSASREIDRMSGRVRLLGEGLLTIGPAAIPLTAGLLPAVTGLGAAAGAAAGGVGVLALAFNGIGDALKAVNDYQLEPTKAHLQAMREEMSKVGASGREFVRFLDGLSGDLRGLQLIARENMFPGFEQGITSVLKNLPQTRALVAGLSAEVGHLAAEAGAALSGDAWAGFVDYVGTDAVPTLDALAHTVGNVALGLANLMVAFAPATRDFTRGMENASKAFADWSANLDDNAKFQDFLAYVRREGPEVVDLLEGLGSMFLGIAHAAAPVGEAVLPVLTNLAKVIGVIGNSPLGPVLYTTAAGMVAVSRATTVAEATMARFSATSAATQGSLMGLSKATVGFLAAGAAATALGNKLGEKTGSKFKDSDVGEMLDAIASGRGQKEIQQLATDFDNLHGSLLNIGDGKAVEPVKELLTGFGVFGNTPLDNAADNFTKVDQALSAMVASGNADKAKEIFETITQAISGGSVPGGSIAPDLLAKINDQFPAYTAAAESAAGATDAFGNSLAGTGAAAGRTAADIDGLVQSMRNQRSEALASFDAETQWRQALKDAAEQAKKTNAGIRGNSDAALQNRQMLSQLAAAWNNQSDAVKNNASRFRQARSAFIETATAMGVPIEQARRLAKQLLEIPRSRFVKVSADTKQAASEIQHIIDLVAGVHGKKIDIIANYIQRGNKIAAGSAGPGIGQKADGGTVPGPRQPYGDKMLILAAPGEEVISNRHGEADRFRADRAAGRIPAYADGGETGRRGPRGQLTGLGGYLQVPELAHRIADYLGARQIRSLGRQMDDLSKKNLTRLGKALDKATSLQEKHTEAAQKAFDAISSERAGYASDITQSLTRDIFAGGGSPFDGGYAANSIVGATRQLNAQTRDAQDMERLERILRERGVHGGALREILSGGIDRVRAAAAQSTSTLLAYQSAYDTTQKYTKSAANTGAALLTPTFDALKAKLDQEVAESRAIKDQIRLLRAEERGRHVQAQQTRRQAPQRTANALGHQARNARRG